MAAGQLELAAACALPACMPPCLPLPKPAHACTSSKGPPWLHCLSCHACLTDPRPAHVKYQKMANPSDDVNSLAPARAGARVVGARRRARRVLPRRRARRHRAGRLPGPPARARPGAGQGELLSRARALEHPPPCTARVHVWGVHARLCIRCTHSGISPECRGDARQKHRSFAAARPKPLSSRPGRCLAGTQAGQAERRGTAGHAHMHAGPPREPSDAC